MKKTTVFILVFTVIFMAALSARANDVTFGIRGGLNIANFTGDDTEVVDDDTGEKISTESLLGMAIGGYLNIPISETFSIQPELIYSQKGAKYSQTYTFQGMEIEYEAAFKLDYLDIPVLAKISFPSGSSTPYLYFGPSIGMNLSAKLEVEVTSGGITLSDSADMKDYVKSTDTGIVVGGGIQLTGGLSLDARYTVSLSTIDEPAEGFDEGDIKNSVVSILAGYRF